MGHNIRMRRMSVTRTVLLILLALVAVTTAATENSPNVPPQTNFQEIADQARRQRQDARNTIETMVQYSTMAGSFKPIVKKLLLSKTELELLVKSLTALVHWSDVILIAATGWLIIPLLKIPYERVRTKAFRKSKTHLVATHLQQIARIALAIYAFDVLKLTCIGIGFDFCKIDGLQHSFAQGAYLLWAANRLSHLKKFGLRRYINRHPETFGRMQIVNRLLDAGIYGLAFFCVLNILKVEMGLALTSIFAIGSAGTVALGLASKGIATNVINGLMLASSDRIYEGDSVRFSNGLAGTIVKLGWMETILRGSDEIMVSIPNEDLLKHRVMNLSRVRYSQVKQILRFKHSDADKIPQIIDTIKAHIESACPTLIRDGTRPWRVTWTEINKGDLEVEVDAHFLIKPVDSEYYENRQRVLQAIHRAVKSLDVSFA